MNAHYKAPTETEPPKDRPEFTLRIEEDRHPTIGYALGSLFTAINNQTGAQSSFFSRCEADAWIRRQAVANREGKLFVVSAAPTT